MKTRAFLFTVLGFFTSLHADWFWTNVSGEGAESNYAWNALYFVNPDTGWVVGIKRESRFEEPGVIMRTTNGGVTWHQQYSGSGEFGAVQFFDARTGWAMHLEGASSVRTTNGGETWLPMQSGGYAMHFLDSLTGWILGDNSSGWKTSDGGASWNLAEGLTGSYLQLLDRNTAWRLEGSRLMKTVDGGATWATQHEIGESEDRGGKPFHFVNASTGWVAGAKGMILKTTDGGETWASQTSGTSKRLTFVNFINDSTGYVAGYLTVLKTIDGGNAWVIKDTVAPASAYQLIAGRLYGVGGDYFYREDSPPLALRERTALSGTATLLPGTGAVRFHLPRAGRVDAFLLDTRGKVAARLIEGPRPAGYHEVSIPLALPSGRYLLELRASGARHSIPWIQE